MKRAAHRLTALFPSIHGLVLLVVAIGTAAAQPAPTADLAGPAGYYRYPALHGETIVFVAEGDLWTAGIEGGQARRLTTHLQVENHPAISPDGSLLAFTASYEGPAEVYTMPLHGGLPTRRTHHGEWTQVVDWTPDGRVLYATQHFATLPNTQLATVDLATGAIEPVPLAQAAEGSYEPTGRTLFFTRLAQQGSHAKGYRGGTAQSLWRYTAGEPEAVPLTADYPGTSRHPMWWNGRVYFASDRDFDQARERWIDKPLERLSAAHISPDGTRLALTAYGQVFVAPVEQGRLVEVTRKSGVRYRSARFTPDGQSLLVLSDQSGEVESPGRPTAAGSRTASTRPTAWSGSRFATSRRSAAPR